MGSVQYSGILCLFLVSDITPCESLEADRDSDETVHSADLTQCHASSMEYATAVHHIY